MGESRMILIIFSYICKVTLTQVQYVGEKLFECGACFLSWFRAVFL